MWNRNLAYDFCSYSQGDTLDDIVHHDKVLGLISRPLYHGELRDFRVDMQQTLGRGSFFLKTAVAIEDSE